MSHLAIKDPDSTVNYSLRWYQFLNGDTISTSTWTVEANESPVALTISTDSIGDDTNDSPVVVTSQTTVVVAGGTPGITYTLNNRITTAGGLTGDNSISLRVQQK